MLSNLLGLALLWAADPLDESWLSRYQRVGFEYEDRINTLDTRRLKNSWISPITLEYGVDWSDQSGPRRKSRTFSVRIDQPIFRSGGIYYGIRYAQASGELGRIRIREARRDRIAEVVKTLFELRKIALQKRQTRLFIRNDEIDIRRKQEQYDAGVIDSSFLDQAILQRNRDKTKLLGLELQERALRHRFATLSDKDPDRLRPPHLRLISSRRFEERNLRLAEGRAAIAQKEYNAQVTRAKYLPAVTLSAAWYDSRTVGAPPGMKERYGRYGLHVRLPLSINAAPDIEARRLEALKAGTDWLQTRRSVRESYRQILETLRIIDRKIALARSDAALYRRLLKSTRQQAAAGNKTELDVRTMHNALEAARLDAQIYEIEKQIQLLKLYREIHE